MQPQLFFKMFGPYAVNSQVKHGVPASITLAQAALESGWGDSGLTKSANNFFGIKSQANDGWTGPSVRRDTTEYVAGTPISINSAFRKYSTPQASFDDHAEFLKRNRRYKSLFALDVTDYIKWAQGLQAAGYATDPTYSSKLINLVVKYKLTQFDQQGEVKKKSSLPPPSCA